MLLVEDRKLALDDAVTKFLADAPPSWSSIKVEHLLTHTSGLPREAPGFDAHEQKPVVDVIRSAYGAPLLSEPGVQFLYGSLDYFVLAEIITRVSGRPWADFLRERIFAPLKMTATRATDTHDAPGNRASGYVYRDNELREAPPVLVSRPSGASVSSLADLVKWDAALRTNRPLPRDARSRMWTSAKLASGNPTGYGYGWWTDEFSGHARIRHGGDSSGFRAEYARFPDDRVSVIVLVNGESARPDAIAIEVASRFVDRLSLGRKPVALDHDTLRTYAGRYLISPDNVLTIGIDGGGLSVQSSAGGAQYHLTAESPGTFFISPEENYQFTVWRDVSVLLTIRSGVQELQAKRVQ
jgi:CubicO group peptidase (beta-lactamase class C family)